MRFQRRTDAGYSLPELLTVVAILGLVTLVAVPAFVQVIPQYRMRGTASEIAATLRMARQDAIAMRRPYRVTFDGGNDRYAISRLTSATAARTTPGNWEEITLTNRKRQGLQAWWKQLSVKEMDLRTNTANPFYDVDCANGVDVIFLRDGTVATDFNTGCGGGGSAALTFTTPPTVVLKHPSTLVRYNTYYIEVDKGGVIRVTATKE